VVEQPIDAYHRHFVRRLASKTRKNATIKTAISPENFQGKVICQNADEAKYLSKILRLSEPFKLK
jgi:hypothetical protein